MCVCESTGSVYAGGGSCGGSLDTYVHGALGAYMYPVLRTGCPHAEQNTAPGSNGCPQWEQNADTRSTITVGGRG